MNVTGATLPDGMDSVVGVKTPPAPLSDGVMTVTFVGPALFATTEKLLLGRPTVPDVGPASVTVVDGAVLTTKVIGLPAFVRLWLLVIEMLIVPAPAGV